MTTRERLLPWLPPVLAALAVTAPLLADPLALVGPDSFRSFDWLESAKLDAYTREALLRFGSLPRWNPLLQGGLPQLAHPSDGSLSPFVLPSLLLGPAAGMKVSVILALAMGAAGVGLLARDRCGLPPVYAAFAGSAYAVAGWVPTRVMIGYYESCLYAGFPLAAWLLLPAERRRPARAVLAAAGVAVAAIQLHLGLLVLLLLLGVLLAMGWIQRTLTSRGVGLAAGIVAAGGALAAIKLVPMAIYLRGLGFRQVGAYPEPWGDQWYASPLHLLTSVLEAVPLVSEYKGDGMPVQTDFGHVGLGVPLLLLMLLAAVRLHRLHPGLRSTFVVGLLCAWLCLGPNAGIDAFHALWQLPGFHSMRGSVRYLSYGLVWAGCLLAAGGLYVLSGDGRRPWVRGLGVAVAVVALAWPAWESGRRYALAFTAPVPAAPGADGPFVQDEIVASGESGHARGGSPERDEGNLLIYRNLLAGIGTIYAPPDLPADPAPVGRRIYSVAELAWSDNAAYRGEAFCVGHDCGARLVEAGPGTLRVTAVLERADTLCLNQTFQPGWTADGEPVVDHGGLLAVDLARPGPVDLTLRYRAPGFAAGAVLSGSTLAALLAASWLVRRRSLASAAPPAV